MKYLICVIGLLVVFNVYARETMGNLEEQETGRYYAKPSDSLN